MVQLADKVKPTICLTEYSHGAGCGCKIAPHVLEKILKYTPQITYPQLVVGHEHKDDAAVLDLQNGYGLVSTTDFFMPIVDDPFTFGQIAAANAISDVYAMGGTPQMAIAILGWPVNKLSPEVAAEVLNGGRETCNQAAIPLAGGHSIDTPEPIFGLAVSGKVKLDQLKKNNAAECGDLLFLTKPLGIGILSTAQKQKKLKVEDKDIAPNLMLQLNRIGAAFARIPGVHAMTDVTGFGLAGHLLEICTASQLSARIDMKHIPILKAAYSYYEMGCVPGGTERNFISVQEKITPMTTWQKAILCDPQTSGGLLVTTTPSALPHLIEVAQSYHISIQPFGTMIPHTPNTLIQFD